MTDVPLFISGPTASPEVVPSWFSYIPGRASTDLFANFADGVAEMQTDRQNRLLELGTVVLERCSTRPPAAQRFSASEDAVSSADRIEHNTVGYHAAKFDTPSNFLLLHRDRPAGQREVSGG